MKEYANHRYTQFRLGPTTATYVRSVRGTANSVWPSDRVDFDSKGRIVDLATAYDATTKRFRIVRLRVDSGGNVVASDTVPKPPADSLSDVAIPIPGGTSSQAQPFGARELHAYGANGEAAHAVSSRYAVLWVSANGTRRALLERPSVSAPALSESERALAEKTLDAVARSTGIPRANLPLNLRLVIKQLRVDRVLIFEDTAQSSAAFDRLRSAIDQRRISVFPSQHLARLNSRGVRATPAIIFWSDGVAPKPVTLSPLRRELVRQVRSAKLVLSARDGRPVSGPVH